MHIFYSYMCVAVAVAVAVAVVVAVSVFLPSRLLCGPAVCSRAVLCHWTGLCF